MQYYVKLIRPVCYDGKKTIDADSPVAKPVEGFTDWYPEEDWPDLRNMIYKKYRLGDFENPLKFRRRFGLSYEQKFVPVEVTIKAKHTTISKPTEGRKE